MSSKNKVVYQLLLFFLFGLGLFTRFYKLNWGQPYYFHPDENNMATALSQLSLQNFNPHFFAYGQFPLYLGFFTLLIFHQPLNFASAVFILRFWSAIFSFLSLIIFYRLYPHLIFLLLLIFSPGLIQIAHFGTTESLLLLVFAGNLYLSKLILIRPLKKSFFLISALITGLGLAGKISAAIFLTPILLAIIFSLRRYKNLLYPIFGALFLFLATLTVSILFSPYNLIAQNDFRSALSYETQVATGVMKVFYTNQFLHSPAYLFQLIKIFPYTSGLPVYIFSLAALIYLVAQIKKNKFTRFSVVIIGSVLIYFLYFGQVYVKWTRFMSPLFFIPPLLTAYLFRQLRGKLLKTAVTIICLIPGLFFMNLYFSPDIRLQASAWIDQNIPPSSFILSEAGNVVNLPLTRNDFHTSNFDFYNLDSDSSLFPKLISDISSAEYILIPSRRIFANQFGSGFPYSSKYYQSLADGRLGFIKIQTFSPKVDFLLNSEAAEETWSVFDHPTIRLYKKVKQLSLSDYETLLKP